MNKWRFVVGICIAILLWGIPIVSRADAEEGVNENAMESSSDTGRADDWFTKPKEVDRIMNQSSEQEKRQNEKEQVRYVFLMNDNGFAYYLDKQNARWKKIPYSESEDILDVWIRLVKTDDSGEYSYPPKYYLEHYYLRPKKQQVQFLSELEVTGRPNNAIKERAYSVRNWENLVPGSLEDEIYHKVLSQLKKDHFKDWFKGKSLNDVLDETFRISI